MLQCRNCTEYLIEDEAFAHVEALSETVDEVPSSKSFHGYEPIGSFWFRFETYVPVAAEHER